MVLDDIFDHFLHLWVKWQQSGLDVGLVCEGYVVPCTGRYVIWLIRYCSVLSFWLWGVLILDSLGGVCAGGRFLRERQRKCLIPNVGAVCLCSACWGLHFLGGDCEAGDFLRIFAAHQGPCFWPVTTRDSALVFRLAFCWLPIRFFSFRTFPPFFPTSWLDPALHFCGDSYLRFFNMPLNSDPTNFPDTFFQYPTKTCFVGYAGILSQYFHFPEGSLAFVLNFPKFFLIAFKSLPVVTCPDCITLHECPCCTYRSRRMSLIRSAYRIGFCCNCYYASEDFGFDFDVWIAILRYFRSHVWGSSNWSDSLRYLHFSDYFLAGKDRTMAVPWCNSINFFSQTVIYLASSFRVFSSAPNVKFHV